MKSTTALVLLAISAAVFAAACGTSASDADTALDPNGAPAAVTAEAVTPRPAAARPKAPASREVTIPSGTTLQLALTTAVASDTSRVEDAVSARLTDAVIIGGREVLPAGATVAGLVTSVDDSGRVKGRASLAMDFTSIRAGGTRYDISTGGFSQLAPATKGEDAAKIGVGAGAGAIIGGILGGKKGAAQGAAVGGGAGTGVVLATKGKEVRLANGADVSTQLTAPLTVRLSN